MDSILLAPAPDHVADESIFDFDIDRHLSGELLPHDTISRVLESAGPVFWTRHTGGCWIVIGHQAYLDAARDTETFSSNTPSMLAGGHQRGSAYLGGRRIPDPYPICLDGEMHRKYRAPLLTALSPKRVKALETALIEMASGHIDRIKDRGSCDVVQDIAEPIHLQFFMKIFGLDPDHLERFYEIIHAFKAPFTSIEEHVRRQWLVLDVLRETLCAKRSQPEDDLLSTLWRADIDGAAITMEDMENYGLVLFTAGMETTINAIALGIRHLATDPLLQRRMRDRPGLLPILTEEMLRRYSFSSTFRVVTRTSHFHGSEMRRGDRVMLVNAGANLDGKAFPEPHDVDLERERKTHLAFGMGPHRCVGSHLARVELNALYRTLLDRLSDFRLDASKPAKFHGGFTLGLESLRIEWD